MPIGVWCEWAFWPVSVQAEIHFLLIHQCITEAVFASFDKHPLSICLFAGRFCLTNTQRKRTATTVFGDSAVQRETCQMFSKVFSCSPLLLSVEWFVDQQKTKAGKVALRHLVVQVFEGAHWWNSSHKRPQTFLSILCVLWPKQLIDTCFQVFIKGSSSRNVQANLQIEETRCPDQHSFQPHFICFLDSTQTSRISGLRWTAPHWERGHPNPTWLPRTPIPWLAAVLLAGELLAENNRQNLCFFFLCQKLVF